MSLFGNLNGGGIKGPDVVINGDGGSLLPTSSAGMRFSPAQINRTGNLLGGVTPYNYGQGSVSDDIAQQVTPHKVQKIVPRLMLPSAGNDAHCNDVELVHSVDDGDLAFTIKLMHDQTTRVKNYAFFAKQQITRAVDPIINLATVNYILRGLQTDMGDNETNWASFLLATGWPSKKPTYQLQDFRGGPYQHRNVSLFIQDFIRPFGVVIGSSMQGGQHQGSGGGAVDFPVDHVVTILVDGLCDNMLNLWKRADVKAGDDLLLALCGYQVQADIHDYYHNDALLTTERPVGPLAYQFNTENSYQGGINIKNYAPPTAGTSYVLNHWPTGKRTEQFTAQPHLLFELVPTTSSEIDEGFFLGDDRRNRGLWHIARSQVQIRSMPMKLDGAMQTHRSDNANLTGGSLVQCTVGPTWKSASSCRSIALTGHTEDGLFHGSPAYNHNVGVHHIDTHKELTSAQRCELIHARKNNAKNPRVHSASHPHHTSDSSTLFPTGSIMPQYMTQASATIQTNSGAVKRVAEETVAAEFESSKRQATAVKRSVMDVSMDVQATPIAKVASTPVVPQVFARSLTTNSAAGAPKAVSVAKVRAAAKQRDP
jgi:hypothetical protein